MLANNYCRTADASLVVIIGSLSGESLQKKFNTFETQIFGLINITFAILATMIYLGKSGVAHSIQQEKQLQDRVNKSSEDMEKYLRQKVVQHQHQFNTFINSTCKISQDNFNHYVMNQNQSPYPSSPNSPTHQMPSSKNNNESQDYKQQISPSLTTNPNVNVTSNQSPKENTSSPTTNTDTFQKPQP